MISANPAIIAGNSVTYSPVKASFLCNFPFLLQRPVPSDFYRTENVFFLSGSLFEKSDYLLPAGEYLCLFYQGSLKKTKLLLPRLFDYANAQKLTITGHPMELCHIDGYETDDEREYVIELELPVSSH